MKVLVTGADGMLGSNLVRLLLERGHEISVLLHPASISNSLDGLDIKRYSGDILQTSSLESAFQHQDAVIHAAASTSIWPPRSETVRRINIDGTRNIIEAALQHRLKRMVYVGSASSVNAENKEGDSNIFPGARFGLDYIDSKHEALNLVMEAVKTRNLPALAVLPTYMIGPYDSLPGSGKMILALARGQLKVYTRGGRNFIHVRDVAVAIANSLEEGGIGMHYIAGNENLTYREFFSKVARIVCMPEPRIAAPAWLVKTIGLAGSISGKILHREPVISYPMARISCEKQFVNSSAAIKALQLPQTNIETAIAECYQWFIDNNYLKKT